MNEPQVIETTVIGRDGAFRDLVEQHKRSVYYLGLDLTGNHHDAEDLSQEVFIKAHRGLSTFRGEASVETWLRRITVNTYLNKRRKKALSFMRLFGEAEETAWGPADAPTPDQHAEGSVVQQHVTQALKKLSPRERSAFVLRHYHDLSVKEVAGSMEVAEGTVKSLLYRATQKLQKALAFYRNERG